MQARPPLEPSEEAPLTSIAIKICSGCGEPKPLETGFHRNKSRTDGRDHRCKECAKARHAIWYAANQETARATYVSREEKLKALVFDHYGRVCACCGAAENLCIDHPAGDGRQHRIELFGNQKHGGVHFYHWLVKQGFPAGFQTLCARCNSSKRTGQRCRLAHSLRWPFPPAGPLVPAAGVVAGVGHIPNSMHSSGKVR